MRKTMPIARRVFGDTDRFMIGMKRVYVMALGKDPAATLDDLREAVSTLEDTEQIARRVFGGAHTVVAQMQRDLRNARAALRARETPPPQS